MRPIEHKGDNAHNDDRHQKLCMIRQNSDLIYVSHVTGLSNGNKYWWELVRYN